MLLAIVREFLLPKILPVYNSYASLWYVFIRGPIKMTRYASARPLRRFFFFLRFARIRFLIWGSCSLFNVSADARRDQLGEVL